MRTSNQCNIAPIRDMVLDSVCGIMILHMIYGHCIQAAGLTGTHFSHTITLFLCFFMSWFFYKSGICRSKGKPLKHNIIGGKRLLLPFVLYSFIGYVVNSLILLRSGDKNLIHYSLTPANELVFGSCVQGNPPLWFLVTLFVVRILYDWLSEHRLAPWWIFALAVVFAYIFNLIGTKCTMPIILGNTAMGLAFYAVGNACRKWQYHKVAFAVTAISYALFALIGFTFIYFRSNTLSDGCYLQWFPQCLAGILLINNIYYHFKIDVIGLHFIGRNSMVFYVWHWILILLVNLMLTTFGISMPKELQLTTYIIVMAICLPLFCKMPLLRKFC